MGAYSFNRLRKYAVFGIAFFFAFHALAQNTPLARETAQINKDNAALAAEVAKLRIEVQSLLLKRATVKFIVDYDDVVGYGTGVVIGSSEIGPGVYANQILSAAHVIKDPRKKKAPQGITVVLYDKKGKEAAKIPAKVLYTEKPNDLGLAVIYTNRELPSMPVAPANFKPRVGDAVIGVGCRMGSPPKIYSDAASCITKIDIPEVSFGNIEISCDVDHGDSGGPLASKDGTIIGVCHAKIGDRFDDTKVGPGVYINTAEINRFLTNAARHIPSVGMEAGRMVNMPMHNAVPVPSRDTNVLLPIGR
ncbi:MAG: serine protease [Candidatus Pacebacteria bacterium]|nr:serine protease [Candidatus Paceibacterota bacterium]